jgi:hypothetical protein
MNFRRISSNQTDFSKHENSHTSLTHSVTYSINIHSTNTHGIPLMPVGGISDQMMLASLKLLKSFAYWSIPCLKSYSAFHLRMTNDQLNELFLVTFIIHISKYKAY